MFFLVSGAAASGKSTLAKNMKGQLANLECHDHDEKRAVDEFTRCQHLEEWVKSALNLQLEGQDFLLTSHSPLGELLACPSAPKLAGISACLLDCHDTVRITRMRNRGLDPRWPPKQATISWAAWHRMHAWDPQWEQHVIVGNGPSDHSYERWMSWGQNDERWRVKVIDTTNIDAIEMMNGIIDWVRTEREKASSLSPEIKWWE